MPGNGPALQGMADRKAANAEHKLSDQKLLTKKEDKLMNKQNKIGSKQAMVLKIIHTLTPILNWK